jgi:hypothetical protein
MLLADFSELDLNLDSPEAPSWGKLSDGTIGCELWLAVVPEFGHVLIRAN